MNSEPLANLERIGLLDPVPFSAALMQKMLNVAQSRLEDAMRQDNSMEPALIAHTPRFAQSQMLLC
jgi:hypothetical protein